MATKTCYNCDFENPAEARFCTNCSSQLAATGATTRLSNSAPRSETFTVTDVLLSEMLADVHVQPDDRSDVEVTIDGDEELKSKAKLETSGSALRISCDLPFVKGGGQQQPNRSRFGSFSGGSIVISGGGFVGGINMSGTSFINGVMYVDGKEVDMGRKLTVTVKVPFGTTVRVGKLVGTANIGDTNGDLEVKLTGITEVVAGTVNNVQINISGSGSTRLTQANGDVIARISGSGQVFIEGGESSSFSADISGSGSIHHGGTAVNSARLGVSGSGNIYLASSQVPVSKNRSGSGRIVVGREPSGANRGFSDF